MKTSHEPTVFTKDPEKGETVTIGGREYVVTGIFKRSFALKSDPCQHVLGLKQVGTDRYCQTFYTQGTFTASPFVYALGGA